MPQENKVLKVLKEQLEPKVVFKELKGQLAIQVLRELKGLKEV